MKHRLYIDEVGTSSFKTAATPNERYLSLTGVIFNLDYVREVVFPTLEKLKQQIFHSHPDEPIILHRKEIVNRKHPFKVLRDSETAAQFDAGIIKMFRDLEYHVITIVLDKLEHQERYQVWHYEPYHYALAVMLERYSLWLNAHNLKGDVMAEARYKSADRKLSESFRRVFNHGTDWLDAQMFKNHLTSKEIKIKPKLKNISGLQIADLLAHPSFKATLARHYDRELPDNFGGKIASILEESKYLRSSSGQIDGYGRKLLP